MEFPIVDYGVRLLKDNVYRYSIDLQLAIEADLNEKLKIAAAQLWEISTEIIPGKLKIFYGLFTPVKAEIFIEIAFYRSPGTVFSLFSKMKRIFSPLGQIKIKSVAIISVPIVEKDWRAEVSDYLKANWIQLSIGFVVFVMLLALLRKKH